MIKKIFADEEFVPGNVRSNHLELDTSLPLESQIESLYEDLIWVEFDNQISLDVDWRPSLDASGQFYVSLTRLGSGPWKPTMQKSCRSISDLREIVTTFISYALKM